MFPTKLPQELREMPTWNDRVQSLGGGTFIVSVPGAPDQPAPPDGQIVSRPYRPEDPMAGRMSEVVPGWYGTMGCLCPMFGRVSRQERQFTFGPWFCWCCIPCLCCPMIFSNDLPGWDKGEDSGMFRLINGPDNVIPATMVWTSPTTWRKVGPHDLRQGTPMVKVC